MVRLLASFLQNRRLLRDFVARDLKARYVGSSMGFFWSVIFPIINLFVYMFVFRTVLNARWSDHQGPLEVALIMLGGIVVWAAFAETVSRSTNSLVENSNLIQKVVFPSEILPAYLAISSLINMCIGLPVVLICVLWFTQVSPPSLEFQQAGQVLGEGGMRSVVCVQLSRGSPHEVRARLACSGAGELGRDYQLDSLDVRIPSGALTVAIPLRSLADSEREGEESFTITLGEVHGAALGAQSTHTVRLSEETPGQRGVAEGWGEAELAAHTGVGPLDPAYAPLALGIGLVCLPLLFVLQFLFTTGIGYALATLNLFLRDTYHLVGVFLTVWMFGTPIFYPAVLVKKAALGWVLDLNPMYWLIESYRKVMLFGQWPEPWHLVRLAVVGTLVFWLGGRFFWSQKRRFPDLL